MIGLDSAGKSTIIDQLLKDTPLSSIPIFGIAKEEAEYKNLKITSIDIGDSKRTLEIQAKSYFTGSKGLVFVVDSTDSERLDQAKEDLHYLLTLEEMKQVDAVVILANKQDLQNAASVPELSEKLNLMSITDRKWFVQGVCATKLEGVYEGLDWLINTLQNISE